MDTVPNFNKVLMQIEGKKQKQDALAVLKHSWSKLSKDEQEELLPMITMLELMDLHDPKHKKELDHCKHHVATHQESIRAFNHFYSKVITPATSKDHFKNDRIKAAAGLEKCVHDLQSKNLVKSFEIKRVA